jgi:hypothetical protein
MCDKQTQPARSKEESSPLQVVQTQVDAYNRRGDLRGEGRQDRERLVFMVMALMTRRIVFRERIC